MFQRYGANSRSVQITCEEDVSKELLYDAVELVVILLPRCLDYPRCYNLISVAVQKLTKEVDALCLLKDQTVVRSSEHIFLPNYVISLPGGSISKTPERDARHLSEMMHRISRPGAREKVLQVKQILDQETEALKLKRLMSYERQMKVTEQTIQELLKVLSRYDNRPHLYNLIVDRIHTLDKEARRNIPPEKKSSIFELLKATSFISSELAALKCKPEGHATAEGRWYDVMSIDDIIDTFPLISCILNELKVRCHNEAKILQQNEAYYLILSPISSFAY